MFESMPGVGLYSLAGVYGKKDIAEVRRMLARAVELGITYFDVADQYGDAEVVLGEALRSVRAQVQIATKVGVREDGKRDCSRAYIEKACRQSLERLRTDYIDVCQIHFDDPETSVEETIDALEGLQRAGLIRAYGIGHLPYERVREFAERGQLSSMLLELSMVATGMYEKILPLAKEKGFGVIAHGTTGRGMLTGKYSLSSSESDSDNDALGEIRKRYDVTVGGDQLAGLHNICNTNGNFANSESCRKDDLAAPEIGMTSGKKPGRENGDILRAHTLLSRFEPGDIRNLDALFQRKHFESACRVVARAREIGLLYGKSPVQVAINWVLAQPQVHVALVGPSTVEHLEENMGALGWRLADEHLQELNALVRQEEAWRKAVWPEEIRHILATPFTAHPQSVVTDLVYVLEGLVELGLAEEKEIIHLFYKLLRWGRTESAGDWAVVEEIKGEIRNLFTRCHGSQSEGCEKLQS